MTFDPPRNPSHGQAAVPEQPPIEPCAWDTSCAQPSIGWRYDAERLAGAWLPVCAGHLDSPT